MIVFLDGQYLDEGDAVVSIYDRGFLQGDGVFETARLHRRGWFRLDQHLERLAVSAAMLHLTLPPRANLASIADQLAIRNSIDEGTLRITVTRGRAEGQPTLVATLQPLASDWMQRAEHGWNVATARTRRPGLRSMPSQLKCVGRTHSLLARLEEQPQDVDDVLLLSEAGYLCEGPTWNLFWRRGSLLRTPSAATGALEGITRAVILDIAVGNGFTVEQGEWPRAELEDAEEIFATMSSLGVVPIQVLDQRSIPSDAAARLLQARYWELVAREVEARPITTREQFLPHSPPSGVQ